MSLCICRPENLKESSSWFGNLSLLQLFQYPTGEDAVSGGIPKKKSGRVLKIGISIQTSQSSFSTSGIGKLLIWCVTTPGSIAVEIMIVADEIGSSEDLRTISLPEKPASRSKWFHSILEMNGDRARPAFFCCQEFE